MDALATINRVVKETPQNLRGGKSKEQIAQILEQAVGEIYDALNAKDCPEELKQAMAQRRLLRDVRTEFEWGRKGQLRLRLDFIRAAGIELQINLLPEPFRGSFRAIKDENKNRALFLWGQYQKLSVAGLSEQAGDLAYKIAQLGLKPLPEPFAQLLRDSVTTLIGERFFDDAYHRAKIIEADDLKAQALHEGYNEDLQEGRPWDAVEKARALQALEMPTAGDLLSKALDEDYSFRMQRAQFDVAAEIAKERGACGREIEALRSRYDQLVKAKKTSVSVENCREAVIVAARLRDLHVADAPELLTVALQKGFECSLCSFPYASEEEASFRQEIVDANPENWKNLLVESIQNAHVTLKKLENEFEMRRAMGRLVKAAELLVEVQADGARDLLVDLLKDQFEMENQFSTADEIGKRLIQLGGEEIGTRFLDKFQKERNAALEQRDYDLAFYWENKLQELEWAAVS